MTSNLFIPTKIRAGFQARKDTYTQKLAYIIYYDNKGKIRKEKSWEGWRDKSIEPVEFDNVPTDGFTLNKDVKRYSGEWFSSTRSLIRVYDPRGLEFEITTENLIGVLMHTDCLKRGLIGQFVYAWAGQELVLLPINSEEYQVAINYTSGLSKKVKAKELVEGASYRTKRDGDVVYLGKFDHHSYKGKYCLKGKRSYEKLFIFSYIDKPKSYFTKPSVEFLSELLSETTPDYLSRLEEFKNSFGANKIVKYELIPVQFNESWRNGKAGWDKDRHFLERSGYFFKTGQEISISIVEGYTQSSQSHQMVGFNVKGGSRKIDITSGEILENEEKRTYSLESRIYSLENIKSLPLADLYVTFESGARVKIDSLNNILSESKINHE